MHNATQSCCYRAYLCWSRHHVWHLISCVYVTALCIRAGGGARDRLHRLHPPCVRIGAAASKRSNVLRSAEFQHMYAAIPWSLACVPGPLSAPSVNVCDGCRCCIRSMYLLYLLCNYTAYTDVNSLEYRCQCQVNIQLKGFDGKKTYIYYGLDNFYQVCLRSSLSFSHTDTLFSPSVGTIVFPSPCRPSAVHILSAIACSLLTC